MSPPKRKQEPWLGLKGCIREITLDLIEKSQAGEWLESTRGASFYGGCFYLETLASITGEFVGHLWEDIYPLMEEKLVEMDGMVVKSYTQPPPPKWDECVHIKDDGWVGVALLPGHRRMAQELKFQVFNPDGEEAIYAPGQRLLHNPMFGPDVEDIERAKQSLIELIEFCRAKN